MSIKLMTKVWEHGPQNQNEMIVLLCLADRADLESAECYPSVGSVADRCRLSKRGTRQIMRRLEDKGWLETNFEGGRKTNTYRINKAKLTPSSPPERDSAPQGDPPESGSAHPRNEESGHPGTQDSGQPGTQDSAKPSREPSSKPSRGNHHARGGEESQDSGIQDDRDLEASMIRIDLPGMGPGRSSTMDLCLDPHPDQDPEEIPPDIRQHFIAGQSFDGDYALVDSGALQPFDWVLDTEGIRRADPERMPTGKEPHEYKIEHFGALIVRPIDVHPAVQMHQDIIGVDLSRYQRELIAHDVNRKLGVWEDVLELWLGNDHRKRSIGTQIEAWQERVRKSEHPDAQDREWTDLDDGEAGREIDQAAEELSDSMQG